MTRKVIIGIIVIAIATPALWVGVGAYNDYRLRNCTPAAIDVVPT